MNSCRQLSTIFLNINQTQDNGKDNEKRNADGDTPDNVRQIFWEHQGTISPNGEGLYIIRESHDSHIAFDKHTELPLSPKY